MDNYHRLLLNKKKDAGLIEWLLRDRRETEKPNPAMKRKLYYIMKHGALPNTGDGSK
jgi:hypothetical protein